MKKLYRSTHDRMIAGVCGGLAEHFQLDTSLVRIAFVALALVSFGTWIIFYICCAFIIPEKPY